MVRWSSDLPNISCSLAVSPRNSYGPPRTSQDNEVQGHPGCHKIDLTRRTLGTAMATSVVAGWGSGMLATFWRQNHLARSCALNQRLLAKYLAPHNDLRGRWSILGHKQQAHSPISTCIRDHECIVSQIRYLQPARMPHNFLLWHRVKARRLSERAAGLTNATAARYGKNETGARSRAYCWDVVHHIRSLKYHGEGSDEDYHGGPERQSRCRVLRYAGRLRACSTNVRWGSRTSSHAQ